MWTKILFVGSWEGFPGLAGTMNKVKFRKKRVAAVMKGTSTQIHG